MRKLHQNIEMNNYLNDDDSDFDTFSSIESRQMKNYVHKYKGLIRGAGGKNAKNDFGIGVSRKGTKC